MKIKLTVIIIVFAAVFAGGLTASFADQRALSVKILTDKTTYEAGERVKLTLVAENNGQATIKSSFSSSLRFDLAVMDRNNNEVWRWSRNKMFAMVVRPFKLGPGKKISFNYDWKQLNNRQQPVSKGAYYIQGWLALSPKIASPRTIIIIK